MSLYKRGETWWVNISPPGGGQRIRQSTGTTVKGKAQEFHDKLRKQLWDETYLEKKPDRSWQEAVIEYLHDKKDIGSIDATMSHLRWCDPHMNHLMISEIDKKFIIELRKLRKADGVTNSTVNRMLEVIRAILIRARDVWDWVEKVPKIDLLPEPKKRIRWITRDEADKLIEELPKHLADMAEFSLQTGLRKSNVTRLRWEQIDLSKHQAWIYADEIKDDESLPVPLNPAAIRIIRNQIGKNMTYIFTYLGEPVKETNTKAYRNALKRVGIKSFRWHDLRHTWASWHIQSGTPLHILKDMGGWSTMDLVELYAHFNADHLKPYADNLPKSKPKLKPDFSVTNLSQSKEP